MKYGVIDIGSNTMRAVVFQVGDENKFETVVNKKEFAEILSYVEDDALTQEGIERLCKTLCHMKQLCEETQCDALSCFATASLRYIKNQRQVLEEVQKQADIKIRILSGHEEAYCDYLSLKASVEEPAAIGFDLGGGSAQIFCYDSQGLVGSNSYGIGSLAMYNRFVKGLFPNSKQRSKINNFVEKQIEGGFQFKNLGYERIYGMGGTARALSKVHRQIFGRDGGTQGYTMTLDELDELDLAITTLGLDGIKILNRVIPERLVTFIPGLLTIKAIMRCVGAEELKIVKYGVREGYLIYNTLDKERV